MCNLNILITKLKFSEKELVALNGASATSYASNTDGSGVYFSRTNRIVKSGNFVDLHKYRADFLNSKCVITHQRIATSGFSKDNIQPFAYGRFAFAHNGILRNQDYNATDGKSDSWDFFNLFVSKMYIRGTTLDDKHIAETLKKMLENETGSFSIFIWDRQTNQGWYVKNSGTTIYFNLYKSFLYINTKSQTEVFFTNKPKEVKIKDNVVYRIRSDLSIDKMATIPTLPISYTNNYDPKYNTRYFYDDDTDDYDIEENSIDKAVAELEEGIKQEKLFNKKDNEKLEFE